MQSEAAGLPDYAMQFRIRRVGITRYAVVSSVQEAVNYLNLSNARHENATVPREILCGIDKYINM